MFRTELDAIDKELVYIESQNESHFDAKKSLLEQSEIVKKETVE